MCNFYESARGFIRVVGEEGNLAFSGGNAVNDRDPLESS